MSVNPLLTSIVFFDNEFFLIFSWNISTPVLASRLLNTPIDQGASRTGKANPVMT